MATKSITSIGLTFCFLLILSGCAGDSAKKSPAQHQRSTETQSTIEPASFKPLTYFSRFCARCHGPNGSHYGDTFGASLSDHELIEVVEEMAFGPGSAPIEGKELDAQVAFHRSLVDKYPFIIWSNRNGQTISGEVMPGSEMVIKAGDEVFQPTIQGSSWEIQFPDDVSIGKDSIVIVARLHGKETRLTINQSSFSHQKSRLN